MNHVISLMSACKRNGDLLPGKFDGYIGERQIVAASRTPFCDGARALLADGSARPNDSLIMRHAGSQHDALRASVAVAAKLTIKEETKDGKPRFESWHPHPKAVPSVPVDAPMREMGRPARVVALNRGSPRRDAAQRPDRTWGRAGDATADIRPTGAWSAYSDVLCQAPIKHDRPLANTRPGIPAPTMGPGTAAVSEPPLKDHMFSPGPLIAVLPANGPPVYPTREPGVGKAVYAPAVTTIQ
jgi:hypothetical protein